MMMDNGCAHFWFTRWAKGPGYKMRELAIWETESATFQFLWNIRKYSFITIFWDFMKSYLCKSKPGYLGVTHFVFRLSA